MATVSRTSNAKSPFASPLKELGEQVIGSAGVGDAMVGLGDADVGEGDEILPAVGEGDEGGLIAGVGLGVEVAGAGDGEGEPVAGIDGLAPGEAIGETETDGEAEKVGVAETNGDEVGVAVIVIAEGAAWGVGPATVVGRGSAFGVPDTDVDLSPRAESSLMA